MSRRTKVKLKASTIMSMALATIASGGTAWAQTAMVDEIIVTAQRKEERLSDVPIAVTALNQDQLDARQLDSPRDLQIMVPNLTYTDTNYGGANFAIRGIGRSVIGDGADSGVALHVNGAFIQGDVSGGEFFDLDRVEVLRGPQGTLFGRNATGGAINIVTTRPGPDRSAALELGVASFGGRSAEGMVNLPLGEKAATRLAFRISHEDGWVDNLATGSKINGGDLAAIRSSWWFEVGPDTQVELIAGYSRARGDSMNANKRLCHRDPVGAMGCLSDRLGFETPNFAATLAGTLAYEDTSLRPGVQSIIPRGTDPFADAPTPASYRQVAMDFDPRGYSKSINVIFGLHHQFGDVQLDLLSSYRRAQGGYAVDGDFSVASGRFSPTTIFPDGIIPVSAPDPRNQGSIGGVIAGAFDRPYGLEEGRSRSIQQLHEARLTSDFDGRIDFLAGLFYLNYKSREDFYSTSNLLDATAILLGGATPPFFRLETPVSDLSSYAAFGEVYVRLTDGLKLTGGVRWTQDRKAQVNRNMLFEETAYVSNTSHTEAWTGRFGLDWKPSDQTLIYGFYSRGYKGGGFNPNGPDVGVASWFEPEFVDAFEAGLKTVAADRLSLSLSAFHYDYDGLQISKSLGRTILNENVDARIWGLEAEGVLNLDHGWQVDFSASKLHTEVGDTLSIDPRDPTGGLPGFVVIKDNDSSSPTLGGNCVATIEQAARLPGGRPFGSCSSRRLNFSPGNPVNLKGRELPNSPDWTVRLGVQKSGTIGPATYLARLDYSVRSAFWGRIFNDDPVDRIEGWQVLNAFLEVRPTAGALYLRAAVSNLLDEDNVTGHYLTDPINGLATNVFTLRPREVSLAAGVKF